MQVSETDTPTADGLAAWVGGQPHVAAAVKRQAGIRGDLDHFGAMAFLQGLLTVLKAYNPAATSVGDLTPTNLEGGWYGTNNPPNEMAPGSTSIIENLTGAEFEG